MQMPNNSPKGDRKPGSVMSVTDVLMDMSAADPELSRLIEDANARGTLDGLEERLTQLAERRMPPGTRLWTQAENESVRRDFNRFVREASRPLRARGWHLSGNRLTLHAATGHWADMTIDFRAGAPPAPIFLFAAVSSPYLMRTYDHADPERRPRSLGGHASLLWQVWVKYDPAATKRPKPLKIPQPYDALTGIVLGQSNAAAWFDDTLGRLAETMEGLCSDRAIRDWLLEFAAENLRALRYAVLLTRHLGDVDRLPDVLEQARILNEALDAAMLAQRPPISTRDRGRDPLFWSHARFLRFLDDVED
jgi:hypothetical protein